ncbi:UTP:RNA uridylyltransferase 1-like isoform X2 [Tripterygium wilfordii]|uniref:UTP:RNA uridylyltransferase 1-like isoform X2 n=1 Tax=Tripterygium wilfordii TaxID=458696 RepID=UPI0018F83BFE|nr:UTP:RNA uridylyltransferase 1-like isoform X2 [Tripterygium wilfordii]
MDGDGAEGGEFLLSLLHKRQHQTETPSQQSSASPLPSQASPFTTPLPHRRRQQKQQQHQHQHQLQHNQQSVILDPAAAAAVGPTVPFLRDLPPSSRPQNFSPPFHPDFLGFTQSPLPRNQFQGNHFRGSQQVNDLQRLGPLGNSTAHSYSQHKQPEHEQQQKLLGLLEQKPVFPYLMQRNGSELNGNSLHDSKSRSYVGDSGSDRNRNRQFNSRSNSSSNPNSNAMRHGDLDLPHQRKEAIWARQQQGGGNYRSIPQPGFSSESRAEVNRESGSRTREFKHNANKQKDHSEFSNRRDYSRNIHSKSHELDLIGQLNLPGTPARRTLQSFPATYVEEPLLELHKEVVEDGNGGSNTSYVGDSELDDLTEQLVDSLVVEDVSVDKNGKKQRRNSHRKDSRSDTRGKYILSQRMRMLRRQMVCRRDIDSLNAPFLLIYESLVPPEEEKAKQKQLLMLLEKLVNKEWPQAQLYLYGSCANSFGVSKSDIDVCLAMEDADINKSEVLLKLADILQSDNFQNVQALTHARVPIVKLMDPETGISCDICVNNVLAVVNTKVLRDYACIDERLRQLAFIVKHWAKSRGVNETYQGTLSSYAYVLMCIHFLQLRRPAILPCLQEMEATYSVTVDDIDCTFFDQVEKLSGFGSRNSETIAQLVWAFFNYWAYYHDYANNVISVRSGSIIRQIIKEELTQALASSNRVSNFKDDKRKY